MIELPPEDADVLNTAHVPCFCVLFVSLGLRINVKIIKAINIVMRLYYTK